jgi:4-aminobutyrate aminotransferase
LKNPHIKTELPGPRARAIIERDSRVLPPVHMRDYGFVMDHGLGVEAWDVDGNRFLDFAAGIAVVSTGHSHPEVVAAIKSAADRFLHVSLDYWHEQHVALAETMARIAPVDDPVTFFCNSGTETVEAALKLARYTTGRPRFIGFLGGFHGRSMGALSFTSSKYTQQAGFFPTMPGVTHVPFPNNYRPVLAGADQGAAVLAYIEQLFRHNIPADEVAAILVEPIQGEGGYLVPPDGFLQGLRALCDRHGILLAFDEVQCGVGRTGRMFACEHWGVRPDIITTAKGLGSGMPIGLMVARRRLMERWKRGAHGNTFGGNPVCCAAASATLQLVERELLANAARVGAHFMTRLRSLAERFDVIGEVRGRGLMIGMELVEDRASKHPAPAISEGLIRQAFQNGLLLLTCGVSTVRFMPPLVVTDAQVDEAIAILEQSLNEVLARPAARSA